MRRLRTVLVTVAILAIAGAVVWHVYGDRIRTKLVLACCDRAWRNLRDYQADVSLQATRGMVRFSLSGNLRFKKPNLYRLETRDVLGAQIISRGGKLFVHWPQAKLAVEVTFVKGDPVGEAIQSTRVESWFKDLATNPHTRVTGKTSIEGRKCYVISVPPAAGAATPAPENLPPVALVYVDARTFLPARITVLDDRGAATMTLSLQNVQTNRNQSDADFDFKPGSGVVVIQRVFDPEHPESLLLPPIGGGPGKSPRAPTWDDLFNNLGSQLTR